MLRIIQNSSAAGAKSYYSTADYYTETQDLQGFWRGKAAAELGLSGPIQKADWDALCDNRDPDTGHVLTPRQKDPRRVGYDFNFHVPKSVSLLYGLTQDPRVLAAFRESVDGTMRDMEAEMQTRVRAGGRNEDRTTGNMVWGEFVHTTARPVDGVPDPHLHAHCFVFNTTWDGAEGRWKAGQFAGLKRDAPYFEAVFHSRFAERMEALGLTVERTKRGWELAGLSRATLAKFSRRTAQVEAQARLEGVTDPDRKGELGARTREKKRKERGPDALRDVWRSRLTSEESGAVDGLVARVGVGRDLEQAAHASDRVTLALSHCFERAAVVPERMLLAEAMRRSYGQAGPEAVARELASRGLLRAVRGGQRLVTTGDVLAEESRLLAFARDGRGTCAPLAGGQHRFVRTWLDHDQRQAVEQILASGDRVQLLRGAAGTGKTSLMQETVEAIEASGHKVFAFAPSADASRGVLRHEGFAEADTVARLLVDKKLQERLRGQVVWIDEAGLLGSSDVGRVFDLARRLDARVILSGDRRQHGSVQRGAVLRLLEDEAGLVPAELRAIRRQTGEYKQAVQALSDGRVAAAFDTLDKLGWVREAPPAERYRLLADDYVGAVRDGKRALVVSPTHVEGEQITGRIRAELRKDGRLGDDERALFSLKSANLTEADRADRTSYRPGDVVVFHQNAKGYRNGERAWVSDAPLPLDQAARFQVFHAGSIRVAAGDVLRITRNGATIDGKHRLNNGQLVTVTGFDARGDLVLANGWTVSKGYGHLDYGYVVTSHASQGKTVDRVFIGQSSQSLPASSREQFYVSVSRGKERATIYTDDKDALLDAVKRTDDRLTATELFGKARDRSPTSWPVRHVASHSPCKTPEPADLDHVR